MRKRTTLAFAVASAAIVVAAGAASVAAQSTTAHPAGSPSRAATAAAAAADLAGTTVTLPTGDKVTVRTDGAGHDIVIPADLKAGPYLTERLNGDDYVVPLRAVRQQGAAFDLARFDVSALLRGETTAPPPVHPDFPMRTVAFTVLDERGGPVDVASVLVLNVDDSRRYEGSVTAVNGVARLSVPDGHYSAMVEYDYHGADGRPSGLRMGFADFTVAGAATAVTLDVLRTATDQVSVDAPPKPADALEKALSWFRGSDEKTGFAATVTVEPDFSFSLGTSPTPAFGVQHLGVHELWASPDGTADPYTYDMVFPSDGAIGADQHYRFAAGNMATVDNRYHSDQAGRDAYGDTSPLLSWQGVGSGLLTPVPQPGHRVDYVTAHPEVAYWGFLGVAAGDGEDWEGGLHRYRPGQHVTVDWMRGPVAPGFPADTGIGDYPCWACRTGDTLALFVNPLGDSEADHKDPKAWFDRLAPATAHFQLYQGDTKLADLTGHDGGTFAVGPDPAAYRVVYDQTRPGVGHSSSSHAEWTFHSQHSGATTVPDRFGCDTDGGRADCSAVSLLTLNYALPQGLDETVPAGRQCMELTVGHTAGAPAVPVRAATAAYSLDGGATWSPATVTDQGHGRYRVTWNLPASAAGSKVSFAVTAADAAGDTVRQTVTDAVTVS
ncbi:MAG: hypothetical protein ACJ73S_14055 [Mycobacteriales bacterium]